MHDGSRIEPEGHRAATAGTATTTPADRFRLPWVGQVWAVGVGAGIGGVRFGRGIGQAAGGLAAGLLALLLATLAVVRGWSPGD